MSSMHFEATHSDTSNLMHFSAHVFSITGPPSFQPEIKTSAEYVALVLTNGDAGEVTSSELQLDAFETFRFISAAVIVSDSVRPDLGKKKK